MSGLTGNLKLAIEMVPKSCWYSNVRSEISSSEWDKIRKEQAAIAGHRCQICGGSGLDQGKKWPVECHEIWHYDMSHGIQILKGMISLCPRCHQVKHFGLATVQGREKEALQWLKDVNQIGWADVQQHVTDSVNLFIERSKVEWVLDLTYLKKYEIDIKNIESRDR